MDQNINPVMLEIIRSIIRRLQSHLERSGGDVYAWYEDPEHEDTTVRRELGWADTTLLPTDRPIVFLKKAPTNYFDAYPFIFTWYEPCMERDRFLYQHQGKVNVPMYDIEVVINGREVEITTWHRGKVLDHAKRTAPPYKPEYPKVFPT